MSSKHLVKRSYRNLEMYLMYKKQISGHNSNYLHIVPKTGLELMPHADILLSLRTIEASMLAVEYTRHLIMDQLKIILHALGNKRQIGESKASAELLKEYDGIKILFSLLCASDLGTMCCDCGDCRFNYTISDIKSTTVNIFQRLVFLEVSIANVICRSTEFLHVLFSLIDDTSTCSNSVTLIEHLLIYMNRTFDLSTVPGLAHVIARLHGSNLANFCSIISCAISDSDVSNIQPYLCYQKKDNGNSRRVKALNRSFVLGIPGFLSRLVHDTTTLPYGPRYEGIYTEKDHWMRLVDSITDVLGRSSSASPNASGSSIVFSHGHSLREIVEPMLHLQEPLSVLRHLLHGELGNKVRTQLADLKLIPRLSELFDHFIWSSDDFQAGLRVSVHQRSYECSPEANLKIHFLRLLHDFCDQSEYKYLMLNPTEYQEVCNFNAQVNATLSPNQFPSELMCSGSQGLLSKIIATLKREHPRSALRFWLSRVIESYLRNSIQFGDQMFLLRRGLLEHLIDSTLGVNPQRHRKGVLQSSFDLIGELLRFNLHAFCKLDLWCFTAPKQKKFFSLVENNLVDSNLLVRSLVLSYDYFTFEGDSLEQYKDESAILRTVATTDKRICILTRLLEIGKVTKLTQETVSCLNTALVILILEHRRSGLPKYLEVLRSVGGKRFLSHLRSFLLFWQTHYKDGKGCNALQRSTGINFVFWQETVATMVAENKSDPNCILHYLPFED